MLGSRETNRLMIAQLPAERMRLAKFYFLEKEGFDFLEDRSIPRRNGLAWDVPCYLVVRMDDIDLVSRVTSRKNDLKLVMTST